MLRLAARHADAWNTAWFGARDERLRRRLADLAAALEAEGRDPTTPPADGRDRGSRPDATAPNKTDEAIFAGSVDELARAIDAHEAPGADDLIVELEPKTERSLDRLADALRLRSC